MYKKRKNKNYKKNCDKEKILSYSIWYINKFQTISLNRLRDKLKEKFNCSEENNNLILIDDVLNYLEENNLINEEQIIDFFIRNYLNRWKDFNYVKNSLIKKKFNKEIIETKIEEFKKKLNDNRYNYYDKNKLKQKILNKIKKWYSKKEIILKLSSNQIEKEVVENIYEEILKQNKNLFENNLKEKILKYIKQKNINLDEFKDKQKVINYFLRKWFNFQEIIDIINIL